MYGQCPHGNNLTTCPICDWIENEPSMNQKLDDCSHKDWHSDCVHCNFYKVGLDIYKPRIPSELETLLDELKNMKTILLLGIFSVTLLIGVTLYV